MTAIFCGKRIESTHLATKTNDSHAIYQIKVSTLEQNFNQSRVLIAQFLKEQVDAVFLHHVLVKGKSLAQIMLHFLFGYFNFHHRS